MTIGAWGIVLLATCVCGGAQAGLRGLVGARMDACFRNLVAAKDPVPFADVFESHSETTLWQSEFWGKYMHTAVPVAEATGDETLKRKVVAALRKVIAAQEPDGYIGNYRADSRCNERWDVWGIKYTLLGLLYGNRLDPGSGALSAAEKLSDYLISQVGPNGLRPIRHTGFFRGLASCSVLEPVIWLYRETGKGKYLDFAKYIVAELDEPEDSAHLLSEAGQDVFARASDGDENRTSVRKAYEMMSCYHGLLCFYEVTGDRRCLTAAVKTAESVLRTEENVVGGMTSCERWYGGAKRQTECFVLTQETCVLTTWMRLCQKLLELTGESRWADAIERTFYNAYLANMSPDGGCFSQYSSLAGSRSRGSDQCRMKTTCCNENGPRGFLVFADSCVTYRADAVTFNLYEMGTYGGRIADTDVSFDVYTYYPASEKVTLTNKTREKAAFALRVRIPGWSTNAVVAVNGSVRKESLKSGSCLELHREWEPGDIIEVTFDMGVRMHFLNDQVAFTRGPLTLARDTMFNDGDIGECLQHGFGRETPVDFKRIVPPNEETLVCVTAVLPLGPLRDYGDVKLGRPVRFRDFASAATPWGPESSCRVWLPVEKFKVENK